MEYRRYMVKTTTDRLKVFECCLDVMGDDRDTVIEEWMKDYVLTVLQDDVTTILPDTDILGRVDKIFGV